MREIKLGDKVSFSAHVRSELRYESDINTYGYQRTVYKRVVARWPLPEPKVGIIAGVRVLREGTVEGGHADDDPTYLATTNKVKVYLVAVNLAGFYRVLPVDIEPACGDLRRVKAKKDGGSPK
jgi:hypothetical protein